MQQLASRLYRQSPALRIERMASRVQHADDGLRARMTRLLEDRRHRLSLGARALDAVSPLATLGRGYAIVSDADTGKVLTDASAAGERIEARLASGRLRATIDEVVADND
jgi:exodeoxyribonuclease VII large subunit